MDEEIVHASRKLEEQHVPAPPPKQTLHFQQKCRVFVFLACRFSFWTKPCK